MATKVRDLMTRKIIVLSEEDNLERLDEGMARLGVRHLPVVDNGKLVGLISQRDLLRLSVSTLEPDHEAKNQRLRQNTFVSEVMTRRVATVTEDTTVGQAARKLLDGKFGCLPVVDSTGTVIGIVTADDFLRLLADPEEESREDDDESASDDEEA